MCHNRGENLSAILQEAVRFNRSISEEAKRNYHLIVEEYDGEMLTHNKAAKITEIVKGSDLMEPNIVLLAQQLMKNRSWNISKKSYERETCMFHELENTFKRWEKLCVVVTKFLVLQNPPKTLFEIKTVFWKLKWMKLDSSSNTETLK